MSKRSDLNDADTLGAELKSAYAREAATREILDLVNKSRGDQYPVFNAIIKHAAQLCNAPMGLIGTLNAQRTQFEISAHFGARAEYFKFLQENPTDFDPDRFLSAKAMQDLEVLHTEDVADITVAGSETPHRNEATQKEGMRTTLFVPMQLNGLALGCIILYRREVNAFTDQEIAIVESFAAQAVIAVENVRQFREVEERLEREIATGQILGAISRSRADTTPVFEEILESAARLCRAPMAWLLLLNADRSAFQLAGYHGPTRRALEIGQTWPLTEERKMGGLGQALSKARTVHEEDLTQSPVYLLGDPGMLQLVDEEGLRTRVSVPLVRDGGSIGAIVLSRREVSRFSEDDIRLANIFAGQAVIAIENVRQFKALETLNSELEYRVKAQVTEIERMGRLKRFLPAAVADAVVTSGDESVLTSHRALVATLFCDLRGFTAFCESAEPEETIDVLQTYHQEMSDLIDAHGGGVDQRAGDGIMVIFNDPIPVEDPAGDAVRLALAMRAKMRLLCAKWKKLGHRLGFGIGISFGYATVGIVGSAGRFDYTASGTSINTAARLCDMAANDEILISPRLWAAVEGTVDAQSRGEIEMKGIREPVEVFAIVAD